MSVNLSARLANSNQLAVDFDLEVNGVQMPGSERELISAALLDQAQEHCRAIVSCIEKNLTGSAFALARVSFETAVRGIWILRCASTVELERYKQEELEKKFKDLIEEVEGFYGASGQALTKIKSHWSSLCSYTHSGYLQACRRPSPGELSPSYGDDEKMEIIKFSDFFYYLAAIEIFQLVGQTKNADRWVAKFQSQA